MLFKENLEQLVWLQLLQAGILRQRAVWYGFAFAWCVAHPLCHGLLSGKGSRNSSIGLTTKKMMTDELIISLQKALISSQSQKYYVND